MDHYHIYHEDAPRFLLECAQTPAVMRLHDIGMNCGCEYTSFPRFRRLKRYSRWEHSVGVALIVWHFTRDRAQTVAGLLHDVASPVFAHVVDFLRGDYLRQEATEAGTAAMIAGDGQLQHLLSGLGLTTDDVCDYHRYPVADNDAPRLSADRLEYTLGNCINYGMCSEDEARAIYDDLTVGVNEEGRPELMFNTADAAGRFAGMALECSKIYVSDEDRYAMQILAEVLGAALEIGVIREDDLYGTEPAVIERMLSDARTAALWREFLSFTSIARADAPDGVGKWRKIAAKKRCIDPMVIDKGRMSAISPAFATELKAFMETDFDYWIRGI